MAKGEVGVEPDNCEHTLPYKFGFFSHFDTIKPFVSLKSVIFQKGFHLLGVLDFSSFLFRMESKEKVELKDEILYPNLNFLLQKNLSIASNLIEFMQKIRFSHKNAKKLTLKILLLYIRDQE